MNRINKLKITKKTLLIVIAALMLIVAVVIIKNNETKPSKTCTTYDNMSEEQCVEDYIGLSQEEATKRAEKYGYNPKIVVIDGVGQAVNDIGGPSIHLEIEKGVVSGGYFEKRRQPGP